MALINSMYDNDFGQHFNYDTAKNVETNLGASGASSAAELTSSSSRSPSSSSKSTIEDADPSLYRAQKLREYHRKWDKIAADKEIMEAAEGDIKNVTRHNAPQQKNEADERKRKSSTKISMKESAARTAIAEKEKVCSCSSTNHNWNDWFLSGKRLFQSWRIQ